VPVVALAAAWVQLGEVPTLGQVLGAAVIIAGITLAQRQRALPLAGWAVAAAGAALRLKSSRGAVMTWMFEGGRMLLACLPGW
jgi:hypothetical protein